MKKKAEIKKYSNTSVKMYKQCPLRFYYNYVEKLPRKTWSYNVLGSLVHLVLEYFHDDYTGNEQLHELMSKSFRKAYGESKKVSKNVLVEAKALLNDYLRKMQSGGMPSNVISVEESFTCMIGKYKFIGVIDRIDQDGDKYYIWDYKTTKNVKYMDDFQLALYSMWFFDSHPGIDYVTAGYILLRHGPSNMEYNFSRSGLESRREDIIETCDKISSDLEWSKIPSRLCEYCDFHEKNNGPCDGKSSPHEWTVEL